MRSPRGASSGGEIGTDCYDSLSVSPAQENQEEMEQIGGATVAGSTARESAN